MNAKPASPKQLKWLNDLLHNRDYSGWPENWRAAAERVKGMFDKAIAEGNEPSALNAWIELNNGNQLTHNDFQSFLDKLQESPKRIDTKTVTVTDASGNISQLKDVEDGVYYVHGTIFKVKKSKAGKQWAHKLVVVGQPDKGGHVAAKFVYAGGVAKNGITAEHKLTYDKAKEFGALYGICCCCGRLLTNELSVYLGIGPVCGGHEFGAEFKFIVDKAKLAVGEQK